MGFCIKLRQQCGAGWAAEVTKRQRKLLEPIAVPEVVSLDCLQDGADGIRTASREFRAKPLCALVAFRLRQRRQQENALRP